MLKIIILFAAIATLTGRVVETCAFLPKARADVCRAR